MENHEIKLQCLNYATRSNSVEGSASSRIVKQAMVFYEWVTEGDAENQVKKHRGRPPGTIRKRG